MRDAEIEKNTRKQNESEEWYKQRKCRLTSSLFWLCSEEKKINLPKDNCEQDY